VLSVGFARTAHTGCDVSMNGVMASPLSAAGTAPPSNSARTTPAFR
jgi:hypothetical protein